MIGLGLRLAVAGGREAIARLATSDTSAVPCTRGGAGSGTGNGSSTRNSPHSVHTLTAGTYSQPHWWQERYLAGAASVPARVRRRRANTKEVRLPAGSTATSRPSHRA